MTCLSAGADSFTGQAAKAASGTRSPTAKETPPSGPWARRPSRTSRTAPVRSRDGPRRPSPHRGSACGCSSRRTRNASDAAPSSPTVLSRSLSDAHLPCTGAGISVRCGGRSCVARLGRSGCVEAPRGSDLRSSRCTGSSQCTLLAARVKYFLRPIAARLRACSIRGDPGTALARESWREYGVEAVTSSRPK
jgi:hypothetical protein